MTTPHPTTTTTSEKVSLYVHEEGSGELLDAVYEADNIPIPDVGDRFSFVEGETTGRLTDRSVKYTETDGSERFVVTSREFVYLHVEHAIEDHEQRDQLVTEVHLTVTPDERTDDR